MPEARYNNFTSFEDLAQQLQIISDESIDNDSSAGKECKKILNDHPYKNALHSELCEIKQRTGLSARNYNDENAENPDLARLDNMLVVEHVIGPDPQQHYAQSSASGSAADNAEYMNKLVEIRHEYNQKIRQYDDDCCKFTNHVKKLLLVQQEIRPITEVEVQRVVAICLRRLSRYQVQLKQAICERIINLKTRMCDARRKRRNFSKQATQVLNDYFLAHINNPYPSEEVKEELARQCQITVSQVSNWFGNKRIRYKKNMAKVQEERDFYNSRRQVEHSQQALAAAATAAAANTMLNLNPYATNPALGMNFTGTDPTQLYGNLPTDLDYKYFLQQ